MAEVLFYERPVPLNREGHKDLRIKPINNVAFAAKAHSVPLTVAEFGPAARDFPILFGGNSLEEAGPLAMLGLNQSENAFVDANGQWEAGAYVPAFIRRYPFVLAEKPEGAEGDDFTVFLDEDYAGFGTEEGERLFNEDGSDTDTLKNAVRFLGEFQEHVKRTHAFTRRLRELDLLEPRSAQIKDGENTMVINGLFLVNEEKLRQLDEKVAHELLADGSMGWIYAHLLSLSNIDRLKMRIDRRKAAA
ncbi:MAG TPA: SapC family protein [Rhodanobacteraceae bacterium]|nr:SapC family protein [Rhodanobacteraceae bacterium]HET8554485.1 SapC family protein [Rhodanobacteraceae bacterium]